MRVGVVCLTVLSLTMSGCATRKPAPPTSPSAPEKVAPVDVDALMRHGCFRCLEEALVAATGEQAFEVASLLTLRAKELGLPYEGYRRAAGELQPSDPAFNVYLDAIDAIRPDPLAGDQYLHGDVGAASATRVDRGAPGGIPLPGVSEKAVAWREALRVGPGSELFRRYLDVSIACTLPRPNQRDSEVTITDGDAPLLIYRVGACGRQPQRLRALRDTDAGFVDADLTLARYATNGRPADLDEGLRWLRSAGEAFPRSTAIGVALGEVYDAREEWAEALAAYGDVLTLMPEHRDAMLGRTVALSHLKRHDEAIASATHMIDLGAWFLGEAHYWRAWNEFSLQQYPAARADTDRAKSLLINAAVFVLSGLVEWNLLRLPTAESEFEEALKMDFGRCDAAQYLGAVRTQRNKVPEAVAAFKQAIQCFDLSITVRQKLIADIQAGPGSEATKTHLAASHQRAIESARADREQCQQNVAALEKRGTH